MNVLFVSGLGVSVMASGRSDCLKMIMAAPKEISITATASFISDMESFSTECISFKTRAMNG